MRPYHLSRLISQGFCIAAVIPLFLLMMGCETLQTLGKEQREKLTYHVEKAQEEQEEAKEQFQSAFDEFAALAGFNGEGLEDMYRRLQDQYENSQSRAQRVNDRIDKIETVANKLFLEWEEELDQYQNPRLRDSSKQMLTETKERYRDFLFSMKRAESKMYPVLSIFHDQVLYLKHNLNANAVSSLQDTVTELEEEVNALVEELEQSIANAREFIESMDVH
ncbi:MAG: DUF2959 family protein [Candidatus Hinthialibacter sp.]